MDKKDFNNRKVDKVPINKSKEYLWKYIQAKTDMKAKESFSFSGFFQSLFAKTPKFAYAAPLAILLVFALLFTNLSGIFDGGVSVETVHASFEMTADEEDSSGVASESTFTLTASEDLSEASIEEYLDIYPETEFSVTKTGEGEYRIIPEGELESNKIYNFSIDSTSGEYSWAYQIKDTFKITGSIPGDKRSSVDLDSGIEINFSHENYDFENIENYFEISPSVDGYFEEHRNTLVYVPKNGLEETTIYTVTIKEGLELLDSDQTLEEDFVFQFETDDLDSTYSKDIYFRADNYQAASKTGIALDVYNANNYEETGSLDINIYQFIDDSQFLDALQSYHQIPSWCYSTRGNFRYDSSELKSLGTFEALIDSINWTNYIYLPDTVLDKGYYLVEIAEGTKKSQALLQITDLSSYIAATITDTVVWVNDLNTQDASINASIEIIDEDIRTSTDKEGVATFTTPETWKNSYYEISSKIIKITAENNDILFLDLSPYYDDSLSSQYWQLFASDRTKYKANDTVQFWGYLKAKNDSVSTENLTIKLAYNWNNFIKEMPLEINDGVFSGSIDLSEYSNSGWYTLSIFSGEEEITYLSFDVEEYVKPAYDLSLVADKNAVFAGEKINFTAKANFFEGTPVPNLELKSYYSDFDGEYFVTDNNGEVETSAIAEANGCHYDYCYNQHNEYYQLNSILAEEYDISASSNVRVFDSQIDINSEREVEDNHAKINISTHHIDLTNLNNDENTDYNDYLGEVAANQIVNAEITEVYWEKIEDGEYYDFINKKVVKKYRYQKHENHFESFSVSTNNNGENSYEFDIEDGKYYKVNLETQDENDNTAYDIVIVYGNSARSQDYDYYKIEILNGEDYDDPNSWWSDSSKVFDIGNEVQTVFSNNEAPVDAPDGQFLFLQFSNGLIDYETKDSPYYDFDFSNEHLPNVHIGAVWFDGNKYQDAYAASVKYKQELSRLEVDVSFDKESYSPGEDVVLEVQVKDLDGKATNAAVNLSLVDEAFYKIAWDNFEDPLSELYTKNTDGVVSSYDSHDNAMAFSATESDMGGCFTGDTEILMADGSYKPIKDISENDLILTKEHDFSSNLVPGKVVETFEHFVDGYLLVNENLEVTEEHVVFVNGAWDIAGNLNIGDSLLGKNAELIEIYSIQEITKPVYVYNFEVEKYHTYFANDFYVHNDKGGDVRENFEDTALFDVVETDRNGYAKVEFTLPDNITSWRVVSKAIDGDNLAAGYSIDSLKVSLPFFADLIMNSQYSYKDSPIIKFRSYGQDLDENDEVDFNVVAESLGLEDSGTIEGEAYDGSYFELPELTKGEHDITLYAESDGMTDALKKTIDVVSSRLKETHSEFIKEIDDGSAIEISEEGQTSIRFVDSGRAYHYYDLYKLYYTSGDRLDQRLSKIIAAELLNENFDEDIYVDDADLASNYQDSGLQLLPYADEDLKISALTLAFENKTDRFNKLELIEYFEDYLNRDDLNYEELSLGLLGLASLNEPVLLNLRFLKDDDNLDLAELLYIGLAFDQLGSKAEAEEMFNKAIGNLAEDNAFETALAAILAASLERTREAELLWEFVEINGIEDDITNLYELAYIKNLLRHLSIENVEFELEINDHSETIELNKNCHCVVVYPGDSISVDVKEGSLGAYVYFESEIDPKDFEKDKNIGIERTYYVDGEETKTFKEGDLVQVVIDVSVPDDSKLYEKQIFKITDILPSGLKLISTTSYWDKSYPYRTEGQEVNFYWSPSYSDWYGDYLSEEERFTYYASVVNPGEFYVDPAKIESFYDESLANITDEEYVKIKKY